VDGRPNRRNKAAFSHFSGVMWMGRKASLLEGRLDLFSISHPVYSDLANCPRYNNKK